MSDTDSLSPDEALERVKLLAPDAINFSQLARQWGWSRPKVQRQFKTWRASGVLPINGHQTNGHDEASAVPPLAQHVAIAVKQEPSPPPPALAPAQPAGLVVPHLPVIVHAPQPQAQRGGSRVIAIVLGAAAVGLGGIVLVVNATFWAAFAQTQQAAVLLAGIGICFDLLALILPTSACRLFVDRHYVASLSAWVLWASVIAMTVAATAGWGATNIADALAGRAITADRSAGLIERLHRLRDDRRQIAETRSIDEIEQALVTAQARSSRVFDRSRECREPDRRDLLWCGPVIDLRQARARAQQREHLDHEIAETETGLAGAPVISLEDPGATMLASILPWLTSGAATPSAQSVQRARIVGLAVLPSTAGLLLGFASLIWRGRR